MLGFLFFFAVLKFGAGTWLKPKPVFFTDSAAKRSENIGGYAFV